MKKLFLLLLIFTGLAKNGSAQKYWQQQVDYTIDVSLNDAERTLDGFIKINYLNNSPDTLSFIWIHCWPNAYKNDRTAFSEPNLREQRRNNAQQRFAIAFNGEGPVHPSAIEQIKNTVKRRGCNIPFPSPLVGEGGLSETKSG